jgi:glycosyltransferase involved in cell wall biosynthesis
MQKDKEYYDNFFRKHPADVHLDPVRFSEIAKLCRGNVLDVGCGTGNLSDFYSGDYTGIDISSVAVKIAKELRRDSAKFETGDFTSPSFQIFTHFDTIVLTEFLEHIDNDDDVIKNISKIMKPNTRLIIGVPNSNKVPDESHVREFTIPQLRKTFLKAGRVKFYNWPGAKERILMTVDLGQRNDDLLSLVIPCKNEGLGLETAVLSCVEFVDNIVISVDDSSTDNTLDIAKRYADVVKLYKWENSFAKARNFAQFRINTEWVLQLDGHEFVESIGNLAESLKAKNDSFYTKIILENDFSFYFPRLIRNNINWERDVHNYPACKDIKVLKGFLIRHDREHLQAKEAQEIRNKQRAKMVFDIMTEALKKNKKDIRAHFYLAQQYHYNKEFKKALKYYKKYLKYSKNHQERWLIYSDISMIYVITGKPLRALLYAWRLEKELPNRWETRYILAMAYGLLGDSKTSSNLLVEALTPNKEIYVYNPFEQDIATIYDFIGASLFASKKTNEAKIAWKYALDLELKKPEKDQSKKRIEILKRMTA